MAAMKPVLNREAADQKAIGLLKRIDPDIQEVHCDCLPCAPCLVNTAHLFQEKTHLSSPPLCIAAAGHCQPRRIIPVQPRGACMGECSQPACSIPVGRAPCIAISLEGASDHAPSQIKTDVEGTLYVVKRRGQPRFRYIVLNKTGKGEWDWRVVDHRVVSSTAGSTCTHASHRPCRGLHGEHRGGVYLRGPPAVHYVPH